MDIQSPGIAIIKEIITNTFITAVMRGRVFEVAVSETETSLNIGDPIIIYRMIASEQWLFLCIVTEAPAVEDSYLHPQINPDPVSIPIIIPAPTVSMGQNLSPDAVTIPLVITTPSISIDETLTPSPVVIPFVIPEPVIISGTILTPDAVIIPITVTTLAITLELTLTPSSVTIPIVIPIPIIDTGKTHDNYTVDSNTHDNYTLEFNNHDDYTMDP